MENNTDKQYFELVSKILEFGLEKSDRTGTGTISIFGHTMRFNMKDGFPLLTSKKMYFKGIITELLWFLSGDTNINYLVNNNCNIWNGDSHKSYLTKINIIIDSYKNGDIMGWQDHMNSWFSNPDDLTPLSKEEFILNIKNDKEFSKKWGDLGPIYGKQWRKWSAPQLDPQNENKDGSECGEYTEGNIDQIQILIHDLKNNPDSRRLMVNAWNPSEINEMTLPPCHYAFQCYTKEMSLEERIKEWCDSIDKSLHYGNDISHDDLNSLGFPKRKLSLMWNQRSCDVGLGIPYNIASYAILLNILAQEVNMIPDDLVFSGGDCHIYLNHITELKKQLYNETYNLSKLEINKKSIFDLKIEDFKVTDYKSSGIVVLPLSN